MDNLKQKSIEMAQIYEQNPKVESILLAGSVSRGWQDEHSDIELHIFWNDPPSDEDRLAPIKKENGEILSFYPYEDEEWSEAYVTKDGVKLEISSFLTSSIDKMIDDVVSRSETDYDIQCIAASVFYGQSLYGEEKIAQLKNRLHTYPEELTKAMILENLDFGNRWHNREALLNRQDWLMLYSVICDVEKKLLGVLFGLNKMYVHHPAFKWMQNSTGLMEFRPENLYERLTEVFSGKPENSIAVLTDLINDTVFLVEKQFPELINSEMKRRLEYSK
jgi:predicted nucleotidyltransferase